MNHHSSLMQPLFAAALLFALLAPPVARAQERLAQDAPGRGADGPDARRGPGRGARRTVSLREALQLAAKQGPEVAAARAQAAVAAVGVERAWTAWKPDLSAAGTFDHTNGVASIDIGGFAALFGIPRAGLPPELRNPTTIVAQNNEYGTLQLVQPLFSPQGLFLPGVAGAGREAASRGADEAREQLLLGVARAYLGLQGLEGLLQAAGDAERVALQRENDARAQISAGTAVEIALLRAQTDTAAARTQLATLEGQRESLLPLLEALVGEAIAPDQAKAAADSLGTTAAESAQPWEHAFSVQAQIAAVDAAMKQVRYDKLLWLPTVAGIAKGNYNSNGGFSGKNTTYDLMINVTVPLYDRGTRYAAQHEDEARLAQAQAQLASARARSRAAWLGARANLASAQAVLTQAESQAQLATRAQAQIDAAAKAGVATSLDLSDADNKRFAAASAAAQARAALELRRAELAAAEGRLFQLVQ